MTSLLAVGARALASLGWSSATAFGSAPQEAGSVAPPPVDRAALAEADSLFAEARTAWRAGVSVA